MNTKEINSLNKLIAFQGFEGSIAQITPPTLQV
jgi:hypothetical protein